jgi:hypothetical protein
MNLARRNVLAGAAALSTLPLAVRADTNTDIDVAIIGGRLRSVAFREAP